MDLENDEDTTSRARIMAGGGAGWIDPQTTGNYKTPSIKIPGTDDSAPDEAREQLGGKPSSGKFSCLCSPTTHAGSFRCRLHRSRVSSVGSGLSELGSKPTENVDDSTTTAVEAQ